MPRRTRLLRFVTALLIAVTLPAVARAAGFEYGPQGVHAVGRGGAFVVGADDPSAIWWNPSRLALMRGTRMMYNHTLPSLELSFSRAPAQKCQGGPASSPCVPVGDPQTFPRADEQEGFFAMGSSFGLTSDFGLKDWGFGLGVQGPAALGKVAFPNTPSKDEPDTVSATRYSFTNMDALIVFVSASAAWKYKQWFGLGVSLQYAAVPSLKYSLDIIGPPSGGTSSQNDPGSTARDMRVDLNMSDWKNFSAIVGAWVRPLPYLELGVSARVVPINVKSTGKLTISGTQNSLFKAWTSEPIPGRLSFTYPMDVKAGARYVHRKDDREVFDIEADFVWEQWSALDAFRVKFDKPEVDTGFMNMQLKSITLARNLKDSYSVRLGGTYNPLPDHLWVRLGGWWESGAQPTHSTMIDLPSWDRFGIGAGISGAYRGIEIGLSYAHVFQMSRTVAAGTGQVKQQVLDFDGNANAGYAVNEGKYTSGIDIISVGLTIAWEELIHGKKPGSASDPAAPAAL